MHGAAVQLMLDVFLFACNAASLEPLVSKALRIIFLQNHLLS